MDKQMNRYAGAKILVVDDQPANVELLEMMLELAGYEDVTGVTDPRLVLKLNQERRFDLILLDLRMPHLDGFEVMEHLSRDMADDYLPVLVMTAEHEEKTRARAFASGARDFIAKPFDQAEALNRISNVLEVRMLHNQARQQNVQLEGLVRERTEELRTSDQRLRTALENMTGGVFVLNADMEIEFASRNFHHAYHLPIEMTNEGASAVELIEFRAERGDYGPGNHTHQVANRVALFKSRAPKQLEDIMPDGKTLELSMAPLPDGGVVSVFTDITERKVNEAALRLAMDNVVQANQAKSEFMANMSHELRTPLNAILGFSDLLKNQYLGPLGNEQYVGYVTDISNSGIHLLGLVNDILSIEQIEARQYDLDYEPIDIKDVVDQCQLLLGERAAAKNISFDVLIKEQAEKLSADRRAVLQILTNLVGNAVKFSYPGDAVSVEIGGTEQICEFIVKDTGTGIAKDKMTTLTDPFSRHVADPYKAQDGVGLGLSICQSLVDLHHGKLQIESEINVGTRITVHLPRVQH